MKNPTMTSCCSRRAFLHKLFSTGTWLCRSEACGCANQCFNVSLSAASETQRSGTGYSLRSVTHNRKQAVSVESSCRVLSTAPKPHSDLTSAPTTGITIHLMDVFVFKKSYNRMYFFRFLEISWKRSKFWNNVPYFWKTNLVILWFFPFKLYFTANYIGLQIL